MACHEAYAEVSDQVDDALSGCYHFMTLVQEYLKFSPVDPAKNLRKNIRSAVGHDRAGPYAAALGMAEATLLQHLEAEQHFFNKIKTGLLEPLVVHINNNKKLKENVDKKMRMLVTKIMNGKRKLIADRKALEKDLDEYKLCLHDPETPANAKKIPGLKKKVSQGVAKYEQAVKALMGTEKEYKDQIPTEISGLHALERTRLAEVELRLRALSQMMLERSQDMIACRSRLESYVSQLPGADIQHDKLIAQWNKKYGKSADIPLVSYDLPYTHLHIESAKDSSNLAAAEETFQAARAKADELEKATHAHWAQIQTQIDADDAAGLAQVAQQAQVTFKQLTEASGFMKAAPAPPPRHIHASSPAKDLKVAPISRVRMSVSERAPKTKPVSTVDTSFETPDCPWLKLQDTSTGAWYFENVFTGETTLEEPEGFTGKMAPDKMVLVSVAEDDDPHASLSPEEGASLEEKTRLVAEVQNLFSNASFAGDGRYLVRQGTLTKKCRSKDQDYEFFLFNDLLIYGSKSTGSKKLRLHKSLMIDATFRVIDYPPKPSIRQDFAVQCLDKSFVVTVATQHEKSLWVKDLSMCCEMRKHIKSEGKVDVAPVYRQDAERDHCPYCKRAFSTFRRKHHCRKCGELCCGDCSPTKLAVKEGAKAERVCIKCNPPSQTDKKKAEEDKKRNDDTSERKATSKASSETKQDDKGSLDKTSLTSTSVLDTGSFSSTAFLTPVQTSTSIPVITQVSEPAIVVTPSTPTPVSSGGPAVWVPADLPVWIESVDSTTGAKYWYNSQTQTSTWIKPEAVWTENVDSTTGAKYWYNSQTQTSTWIKPEGVPDSEITKL